MTFIAVAPNKFAKGFNDPGDEVHDVYEVVELHAALERTYKTDAHLVSYVLPERTKQPRINKPGLEAFGAMPTMSTFFCDVDNAGHAEWTDALFEAAQREYATLEILCTAGIYHTQRGRRIVQPFADPIAVDQVEPYLRRWLLALEREGIAVDWNCRDWTRHFRLPHVRRAGRAFVCPFMDLTRMHVIALPPLEPSDLPAEALRPSTPRKAPSTRPRPTSWSTEIPPFWGDKVKTLADAVRSVSGEWHTLFLALAGALLGRKVAPEHVPAICRAVSLATYSDGRIEDRELGARTSVARWSAQRPIQGYTALRRKFPGVADAVDAVTARGAEAQVHVRNKISPEVPTPPTGLPPAQKSTNPLKTQPPGRTFTLAPLKASTTPPAGHAA